MYDKSLSEDYLRELMWLETKRDMLEEELLSSIYSHRNGTSFTIDTKVFVESSLQLAKILQVKAHISHTTKKIMAIREKIREKKVLMDSIEYNSEIYLDRMRSSKKKDESDDSSDEE